MLFHSFKFTVSSLVSPGKLRNVHPYGRGKGTFLTYCETVYVSRFISMCYVRRLHYILNLLYKSYSMTVSEQLISRNLIHSTAT